MSEKVGNDAKKVEMRTCKTHLPQTFPALKVAVLLSVSKKMHPIYVPQYDEQPRSLTILLCVEAPYPEGGKKK